MTEELVYCRKVEGESDITLIRTLNEGEEGVAGDGQMECRDCSLPVPPPKQRRAVRGPGAKKSFVLSGSWMQYPMTHHLRDHLNAGHKIPDNVFDRLELEIHS